MIFSKFFMLAAILNTVQTTSAFEGDVTFDSLEVSEHLRSVDHITEAAATCLQDTLDYHHSFFRKWGISPFFGDRSEFGVMKDQDRKAYLRSIGRPEALLDLLSPISCIGLNYRCLKVGFEKVGHALTWEKIYQFTQQNGSDGTALQHALQKLGWKIYYWNQNPSQNKSWDYTEQQADPSNQRRFWGYHDYRYITVNGANHSYLNNTVDDWTTLVDLGSRAPKVLRRANFFVGTAHGGYHVFPGTKGLVIEGHSMRNIADPETIESAPFAPLQRGGAPNGPYKSGLIAIPPN